MNLNVDRVVLRKLESSHKGGLLVEAQVQVALVQMQLPVSA